MSGPELEVVNPGFVDLMVGRQPEGGIDGFLGLIVVDEEHETAYKQEDGVHYHARDMAVVRGRLEGCPVVLTSATPAIETRVNAARGRYRHILLPERFGGRRLPVADALAVEKHRRLVLLALADDATALLSNPELTDEQTHPYEQHTQRFEIVWNHWGQRITGMTAKAGPDCSSTSARDHDQLSIAKFSTSTESTPADAN